MDVVGGAIAAVMAGAPTAFGLSIMAGAATSVGPCAAPRYMALASLMTESPDAARSRIVAFVLGVLTGSAVLVLASRTIVLAASSSPVTYRCLAIAFLVFGIWILAKPVHHCARKPISLGASLFLGAATTLLVSPCCTPVLLALGAIGASSPQPWWAIGAAVAYSGGHVAGLLIVGIFARRLPLRGSLRVSTAVQSVSAGLMIALGSYYAVLA